MNRFRLVALWSVFSLLLVGATYAQDDLEDYKNWTFLVFVNADNNLDSAGVDDLSEMEAAGSTSKVNIVVQMDRWHGPAKRFFVRKGKSDVVQDLGEVNMGDWQELVKFAKWGVETYPAQHYALVVWNHGSGWNKHKSDLFGRGISYDDTDGGHITTAELEQATAAINEVIGSKLDILGFDACLMNMFEVAYQVREQAAFIVGSEETEPGDGWPYDRICKALVAQPSMSAKDVSKMIVTQYRKSYGLSGTTQSAISGAALDELRKRTDAFVAACAAADKADVDGAVEAALGDVQRFYYNSYIDFFHFLELFTENVKDSSCQKAAKNVLQYQDVAVVENGVSGIPFMKMKAKGISIYFPTKYGYYSSYDKLSFSKDSQWNEFLRSYLGLTSEGTTPGDQRLLMLKY